MWSEVSDKMENKMRKEGAVPVPAEYMVNKHLSVVTSCDYGGEIETSLYYDETVVTSSSDTVVNHHNGLEE